MTTQAPHPLPVSVVIPTYQRPDALVDCVRSLLEGTVLPSEIIIVGREDDESTRQALRQLSAGPKDSVSVRSGWVRRPGHMPPVEAGLQMASEPLVAVIDDDVTVSSAWLESMLIHFTDPSVGVVGGRVQVPGQAPGKLKGKPGHVTWYGRTWGNVASQEGDRAVEVDTVMEANWVWRRDLLRSLRMDPVLNYDDASMYGLDLCLQARAAGFRILYEPRALVLHHVKPRAPELDRTNRPARAFSYSRNYTYIMMKHLPGWRKVAFLAWWLGLGERAASGVGAAVADALSGRKHSPGETRRVFSGKFEGIRLWLRGREMPPSNSQGAIHDG
jgi:GT2 family glycosyltransferase